MKRAYNLGLILGNTSIAVGFATLFLVASTVIMPKIEGRFYPVVIETVIARVEPRAPGSTIWGSSVKIRPECRFKEVEWELGGPFKGIGMTGFMREGVKLREGGRFDFGPWDVQAAPADFLRYGRGWAVHQCPHRPWLTYSLFWEAAP